MKETINRRSFVKITTGSLLAVPLVVNAEEAMPKLAIDDPQASALGYIEDSSEVDSAKYPAHEPTQLCSGCALYTADSEEWGACTIFPGKLVAANGWCAAYAPKPS